MQLENDSKNSETEDQDRTNKVNSFLPIQNDQIQDFKEMKRGKFEIQSSLFEGVGRQRYGHEDALVLVRFLRHAETNLFTNTNP